jgi:hypothetical protein
MMRAQEKHVRAEQENDERAAKEKRALSEKRSALAGIRWNIDRAARERAKSLIGELYKQWGLNPKKYATQGNFSRDMADKIETKKDGSPVYSASTIEARIIPMLRRQK